MLVSPQSHHAKWNEESQNLREKKEEEKFNSYLEKIS